jgi:hypothetical protein
MQEKKPHKDVTHLYAPLAAAPEPAYDQDGPAGQIYLELPLKGLVIAPKGRLEVEVLFRGLPLALAVARECHELKVDLSQALGVDDLAISALVVLLRNYARGFGRIVLQGLPQRAIERLSDIGVEKLLGRGWVCSWGSNEARYWLCRA